MVAEDHLLDFCSAAKGLKMGLSVLGEAKLSLTHWPWIKPASLYLGFEKPHLVSDGGQQRTHGLLERLSLD